METFKTQLLSSEAEISDDIFNSDEFNKYITEINENKKKQYSEIELKNLVYCLDYSYHYLGKGLVSDEKFDNLVSEAKNTYSDTILYSEKHMSVSQLPCPMPSLIKLYNTDFGKIQKKIEPFSNVVISSKLDGVSCLLLKNNKISLYTKGNGEKGRNISHILSYININTENIPNKCILRGELIIKKEHKELFNTTRALRSQVIGLINRDFNKLDANSISLLKLIDFVFYHVIKPKTFSFYKQFIFLQQINLTVPKFVLEPTESITKKSLENIYEDFITKEPYDIDGLVIAESELIYDLRTIDSNYNNLIFAFKQNRHFAITTIERIEWQTSKNCFLIPILHCKPVTLLNNKITKISGFNAKNVISKGLGIGAKISITLAGNIIPSIDTVLEKSDNIPLPDNIKWVGVNIMSTVVDFVSISKSIEKYFSVFNIKGTSHKTIFNILVKLETEEIIISDIFSFFAGIQNWQTSFPNKTILGEKKDQVLFANIKKMKETPISIVSILVATNYFYLISDTKMKSIFEDCPDLYKYILDEEENEEKITREELLEELLNIPSIATKIADNILNGLAKFKSNKKAFDENFKIIYDPISQQKNKILKVVFTEVKNVESYLEAFEGCFILALAITKNIDYLVTPNKDFKITTKYTKAEKYNIPIITLKEFKEIMNMKKFELAL